MHLPRIFLSPAHLAQALWRSMWEGNEVKRCPSFFQTVSALKPNFFPTQQIILASLKEIFRSRPINGWLSLIWIPVGPWSPRNSLENQLLKLPSKPPMDPKNSPSRWFSNVSKTSIYPCVNQNFLLSLFFPKICPYNLVHSIIKERDLGKKRKKDTYSFGLSSQGGRVLLPISSDVLFSLSKWFCMLLFVGSHNSLKLCG